MLRGCRYFQNQIVIAKLSGRIKPLRQTYILHS
jgi:hypothetical protein